MPETSTTQSPELDTGDRGVSARMAACLILGAGIAFYFDSFQGAFVYDEINFITNNAAIRRLWPPWQALFAPINVNRPLIGLSNAVNYAISGLNPWSYHALNLIIHLAAALALFGIIRRTLEKGTLTARFGAKSTSLALIAALIWMVHPLQTQSVTYVIQRCESLMGMFYLVTLYCSMRAFDSTRRGLWFVAAVAACAGGMMSKQVMVTAPLLVVLYDLSFKSGSIRELLRERWLLYSGLAATWGVLAATIVAAPVNDTAGFSVTSISPWAYCKSEFGVIVYYLRLAFWPSPLCLDYYGWPRATAALQIIPYAAIDGILILASIWALIRRHPAGFLGTSFFLIISVTSSIMPFSDLVFEHRMYVPLALLVTMVVLASYCFGNRLLARAPFRIKAWGGRPGLVLATVVIVVLGSVTARRNIDYESRFTMWSDVVAKRPDNARAHNNLGEVLAERNELGGAMAQFREAVRVDPDFSDAQFNLANSLSLESNFNEAADHMLEALRANPKDLRARFALGTILTRLGQPEGAINEFRAVVENKPEFAEAHQRLGAALEKTGRIAEAKREYDVALQLRPDLPGLRDHAASLQ